MRVLLSLYACEPDVGSEPGGGWNWACALALEGCEVVALVPSNLRAVLEEELERRPRPRLHLISWSSALVVVGTRTSPTHVGRLLSSSTLGVCYVISGST